ncbi:hypothetical protein ABT039_36405 [Streptomyces lasiicapitis]|uniref:hypothetical protein n=1 Tax=Streptomyces lasiicapitis TaxID=1923961 RepID=UPI00332480C2
MLTPKTVPTAAWSAFDSPGAPARRWGLKVSTADSKHFEKRKVSIGTCTRAFSSPCIHEHACVRSSLLRPDPAQRSRLEEIRDNLVARIAEAEREGWLDEVEGLRVSLAGAKDKLAQVSALAERQSAAVQLGLPGFSRSGGTAVTPRPTS